MNLEGIMLGEIHWTEKDKYHMISLICGIQSKKKNKTQNYRCRKQIGGCQRWWLWVGGVTANEYGISFWGDENILKLDGGDSCKTV